MDYVELDEMELRSGNGSAPISWWGMGDWRRRLGFQREMTEFQDPLYSEWGSDFTSTQHFQNEIDFEGAAVCHKFSSSEVAQMNTLESLDYLPPASPAYLKWLQAQPRERWFTRWFMMFCIGTTTGLLGYVLYSLIDLLASLKLGVLRSLLSSNHLIPAWLFLVTFSVGLTFLSACLVVYLAPATRGSGVAEVMAYLNGVQLPSLLGLVPLAVKLLSCALALAAGMPIGPEGPMIHIGAMVGAALSQGESSALGCATPCAGASGLWGFKRFRNNKDNRDFVTAGVAVGVAVAFGAPVGGLLFAFEEVASFWQGALGWHTYFCCMVGVFSTRLFKSAETAVTEGHFGLFDNEWAMPLEVTEAVSTHALAILPAALVGLCCGVLGALFTWINLKVARLRKVVVGGSRWRQLAEPCVIAFIFSTLVVFLPLAFPCTLTSCHTDPLTGDTHCRDARLSEAVEKTLEMYICEDPMKLSLPPTPLSEGGAEDGMTPQSPGEVTSVHTYNQLATLAHVTGEDAIRHLFSRGTHREFSYGAVLTYLILYFLGASWTAGSYISSGLFVPMLVIGGCVGRLVGLGVLDLLNYYGYGAGGVFLAPSPWSWVDPGVFALIGAGSFMAGVSRLTISLAVIIMEMSNEVHFMLPVLVGIMLAKAVADAMTHDLYHGLLQVKCVPFLPSEPPLPPEVLDSHPVERIMHPAPIITLHEVEKVSKIRDLLRDHPHNGFPVVRVTQVGEVLVGLVLRSHLKVVLRKAQLGREVRAAGPGGMLAVDYEELERRIMSQRAREAVAGQEQLLMDTVDQQGENWTGAVPVATSADTREIDLRPYTNASAIRVQKSFTVLRTYILFRTLGLRHLTVVDELNRVVGMVTRKDLLGFCIEQKLCVDQT